MISHAQTSLDYNADTIKVSGGTNQYLGETVINIGTSLDGGNTLIGEGAPAENSRCIYIFSDINLTSERFWRRIKTSYWICNGTIW